MHRPVCLLALIFFLALATPHISASSATGRITKDKVQAEAPGDPSALTVAAKLDPAPDFEMGNLRSLTPFQLDANYT
jgi:hypothetical protein